MPGSVGLLRWVTAARLGFDQAPRAGDNRPRAGQVIFVAPVLGAEGGHEPPILDAGDDHHRHADRQLEAA